MSYFGNDDKDHLVDKITEFLKNYKVSTLLEVVSYAIYCGEDNDDAPTVTPEITEYDLHCAMAAGYRDGYEMAKAKFERPQGECKSCRHRDPEDKKCDCGGQERQGCPFPVSDNYYCKYYERGDGECQK